MRPGARELADGLRALLSRTNSDGTAVWRPDEVRRTLAVLMLQSGAWRYATENSAMGALLVELASRAKLNPRMSAEEAAHALGSFLEREPVPPALAAEASRLISVLPGAVLEQQGVERLVELSPEANAGEPVPQQDDLFAKR